MIKYCECDCGEEVKNRFVQGHNRRRAVLPEKTKQKMSEINKGKVLSEEHKLKISETMKSNAFSKEHCRNLSKNNKGKHLSKETKQKIAISHMKCRTDGYCDVWSDWEYKKDCHKNYCEKCGIKEEIKIIKVGFLIKTDRRCSNLCLHHLDFDKKNCCPNNLQTLCMSCHTKIHKRTKGRKETRQ